MNFWIKLFFINSMIAMLGACTFGNGRICGPQTPIAYCDKEAYEKLVHPKAYGEYWIKPGVSVEGWRLDWVACGGMKDGGYSSEAPSGSPTDVLINASKQKRKILADCMQSKGYKYHANSL